MNSTLVNWISISEEIINKIFDCSGNNIKFANLNENKQVGKILGAFWEHQLVVITFKIVLSSIDSQSFSYKRIPTLPEMLRVVMSTYDPLGLIGNDNSDVKMLL